MNVERYGIGGSDAAAAIGLSKWKPPIVLWRELRGELPPFEGNEKTEWGVALEPVIRQKYADRHGVTIQVPEQPFYRLPDVPKLFHGFVGEHAWMRATPDGIVLAADGRWLRGLEVKAVGLRMADQWGDDGSEDVPEHYEIQARWYMAVLGLPRWDFAVLIGGQEYREYTLRIDHDFEEAIVADVSAFWHDNHLAGVPPLPDGSSEYSTYLAERFAEKSPEYIQASIDLDAMMRDRIELGELHKQVEADKRELDNEIRAAVAGAAGVDCSLGRVKNIRVSGRRETDWSAIAAELRLQAGLHGVEFDWDALVEQHTKRGKPHHRWQFPKAAKENAAA